MKKICLILFSLLLLSGCSDSDDDTKPKLIDKNEEFPVHLSLNLKSGGEDGVLSVKNTTKIFTEPRLTTDTLGYRGILMYNNKDSQLAAFDMACPYCWNGNILTTTGDPNSSYECKVCGFYTFLTSGGGYFPDDKKNQKPDYVYLVKYKVTKLDKGLYLVTNPSK